MQYLLELFLDGSLNQSLNEDFLKKQDNVQYQEVISSNPNQYSLITILQKLKELQKIELLQEELGTINEKELYTSFTHGINHNERVMFWAYFLALQSNLNETGVRIVLDASKYHDVGRINDLLDPSHGERSAGVIIYLVDHPIYQKEENIALLKGIVELHSLQDKQAQHVMKKYGIIDKSFFYTLFSILKDADALDRVRLTYMKNKFSSLNPFYLRIDESKKLLLAAHELNEFYMKNKEKTRGGNHEKYIY